MGSSLDPRVATLSPSLYAAAMNSNLNDSQINVINQISGTVSINKKLMSMNTVDAQKQWGGLDPHVQDQLRAMYGEAPYIPQGQENLAVKAVKAGFGVFASPFKYAFKAAGIYNRAINTPYLVYRQIQQETQAGKVPNPFDISIWRRAYDGRAVYDNNSLAALHSEYGNADTFVAMKTIEGLKPGEIIDAYGSVNNEIIQSITKMLTKPDEFKAMLNKFKGAQVSVGRDITRILLNADPNDNKLYSSSLWNKTSGFLDAMTQIVIDPLTWVTGGTSKAITRADKLAELLATKQMTIEQVFARKDIRNTWDNVAGPLIKNLADAHKAADPKAVIAAKEKIRYEMPDLYNDPMMDLLQKNKIFNADSAQKFFGKAEPMLELLAGRVDGTTFFRTGIPIAKRSRHITAGFNKTVSDIFNGSIEDAKLLDKNFVDELRKSGSRRDPAFEQQFPTLQKLTAELNSTKRKIGRLAARFPLEGQINILDKDVDKSLPLLRGLARTIYPKAHADYFAEAFKASDPNDRVVLLRGLYIQIMHGLGMPGKEGGQALMEKILNDKFADTVSFASKPSLEIPPQLAGGTISRGLLEEQPKSGMGGLLKTEYGGPIHFYNAKPTVANLPWSELASFAFDFNQTAKMHSLISALGGVTRTNFVRKMTNGWTIATLFPRLGIRSAIDEAFFYSMAAPGEDLIRLGLGRKLHKGIQSYAGNEKTIPPIKRAILNWLGKNPAKYLKPEERFVKVVGINGEDRLRLDLDTNIAQNAVKIIENIVPKGDMDYIYQALVHNPDIANGIVNSAIGKSALNFGLDGGDLAGPLITFSHLTNMYRELGFLPTGSYAEKAIAELEKVNPAMVVAAHYQNWYMRFTKNAKNFGSTYKTYINPGEIFIRNNGLRTEADFVKARNEVLAKIGINPDKMEVTNQKVLSRFLQESQQAVKDKLDKNWSDVDTAVKRVEMMFFDMYNTFHGSAVAFNDRLLNYIKETAQLIVESTADKGVPTIGWGKAVRQALDTVDYKAFEEYTKGFRPEGSINTDLNFAKGTSNEDFMQKISQWMESKADSSMDWMDAQVNHLFRQPALWATYTKFRSKYAKLEEQYIQELRANSPKMSEELARELAEKKFTEVAMSHAGNSILKVVDNPSIRSNLAWTLRTTGRFYRATEDFYRRIFRLKDVTPQVLFRLRLAHLGLQSNGFIHPDQKGDPYLVMPADNLIFHAINGSVGVITGNPDAIKQPLFNDFAVRLALGNPSFQQDAGVPSLSGPFMAVPILGLQKALRGWGGDFGKRIALELDNAVLGNVNQNLNWTKAIVPSSVQRVWAMLPKGEQDQQETSAAMQAVAYNAAHGLFLSPAKLNAMDPVDQASAISDYLKNIRITAHNVIFMRSFLGLLSPIAPTLQESRDVPSYLKNAGVNGLRPEFSDILQSIMRNSRGKIQDPYEAALMSFTGKYPGRLIYTIARDERQTNVIVNKTKNMQNWMLKNSGNLKTYGEAAYIFAPHVGEYNSDVYLWMQGSGLMKQRTLENYYDEISIAQDRQKYYDIRSQAESLIQDPRLSIEQRQRVIDTTKILQDEMKANNPRLKIALENKSFGIGKQEDMLIKMQSIVQDTKFDMPEATRKKMSTAIGIVKDALDSIQADGLGGSFGNAPAVKQQIKQSALAAVRELGGGEGKNAPQDPIIAEAIRAVFLPLLDFYARNTMKAVG